MKWFSSLLAVFILSLAAYPCQDNGEHSGFSLTTVHVEKSCDRHHDNNCSHKCSPFCFCNCCQANTVVSMPFNLDKIITVPTVHTSVYIISRLQEVAEMIWQPPKI